MSGNSLTAVISDKLGIADLRILRYAVGSTLAMAVAMGLDWPLSFLTPVLTLSFLASPAPRPTLKMGLGFILIERIPRGLPRGFKKKFLF